MRLSSDWSTCSANAISASPDPCARRRSSSKSGSCVRSSSGGVEIFPVTVRAYPSSEASICIRVSRTPPNIPFVVASSWASDNSAHVSRNRRFAHRLYRNTSGSPVIMGMLSFGSHTITFSAHGETCARADSQPPCLLYVGGSSPSVGAPCPDERPDFCYSPTHPNHHHPPLTQLQ